MSTPVALVRANQLADFVRRRGEHGADYKLLITRTEAFEYLRYLGSSGAIKPGHVEDFVLRLHEASAAGDPWPLIADWHITVGGFDVVDKDQVLQ